MKEKDIKHESGNFWVGKIDNTFTVFKSGLTHSVSIQSFVQDSDGLSCAIAYCDYLSKRESNLLEVNYER